MEWGNLIVIAAPSGTGKTTLVKALTTTRPMRPNEVDGINYNFVDEAEFKRMIDADGFLEYATVFHHYYGTSFAWVESTLKKGIDVILEIDWQGMQQIQSLVPDSLSIFILPPSRANLEERLVKRNQDKPEVIKERLADLPEVASHVREFDYVVINDDFDHALRDLKLIIQAERLSEKIQSQKYAALIRDLAGE
jgi:guanylate kinase